MMQQALLIGVLLLTLVAAAIVLWLDARQRRMDSRIEKILARPRTSVVPSIRRQSGQVAWPILRRLVNYRKGTRYEWGLGWALLAAVMAAAAVVYANSFTEFSLPVVYVAAIVAAVMAMRALFEWQRRRFVKNLFRQLPDAIEMVTSAVRSGLPVKDAFNTIAHEMSQPTAGEFAAVCSEMDLGRSVEEALEGAYQRTGLPEYGFFAVTLAVQAKAGGNLSETLQTLADTVRERVALAGRARALSAEVIFSSQALSIAPFIMGGILYRFNPDIMDLLFHDPLGRLLLAYAVGSVLVGNFVMRWMIRRGTTL